MSETGHSEETTGFRKYVQLKISELQGQVSVLRTLIEKRVEQLEAEISADSSRNAEQRRKISKLSKTGNGLKSEIVERSRQTVQDARSLRAEL